MRFSTTSFLLILNIIIFSGCGKKSIENHKTVFRYNETSGITSLDPAFARNQANNWAVNHLFNCLIQLDDNLKVKPCIAKSWSISADGKIYTFFIQKGIKFHDDDCFSSGKGREANAYDFEYSFKRITDPKIASPGLWIFNNVLQDSGIFSFRALNDSIFQIELKHAFPPFLSMLAMQYCSVVPHEAIEKYGREFRQHPVGTGPFMFKYWKEGVKLVLVKNPDYFEFKDDVRLPFLDAVSITFVVDKQTAFLEFIKGNLDLLSGIDVGYKDELLTKEGELNPKFKDKVSLGKSSYLNTEYLGIQLQSTGNPLKDKNIRQALSYGFDRVKMIKYLRNNIGKPGIHGFVPDGLAFYNQKKVKGYDYNPQLSKELLAKAGYPNGKNLPPITLSTNASYLDLSKYIQSELNNLGFNIKIDVVPPATLKEQIAQAKVPFFRGSWIADYPDAENYLALFTTANFTPKGPNYTHFSSAGYDKKYTEAVSLTNDSIRAIRYMELDNLLMEEAPVIVLFYDEVTRFTQKNITGLKNNALNLLNLKEVKKLSN